MNDENKTPLVPQESDKLPEVTDELRELYRLFDKEQMIPLWTQEGDLMPDNPKSNAQPHRWEWKRILDAAAKSGDLVPIERGGDRRAIALANPSLNGRPYTSPTLWCAIQYLMPGEEAPEHRHTQNAFRFIVEGEGVWTVVNGDPVPMRRGDFLPQFMWNWHAHTNAATAPMAWIDGLDIPFQYEVESQFFELGRDKLPESEHITPNLSRSQRLWGFPGVAPVSQLATSFQGSPLLSYRWEDTDRALDEQLALEKEGFPGVIEPGHALVRYLNPSNGHDVLPTIRTQFHRLLPGTETTPLRRTGSAIYQVFQGAGTVSVGQETWSVGHGDIFVVPSWQTLSVKSEASGSDSDSGGLDLFEYSDAPIFEKLDLYREEFDEG